MFSLVTAAQPRLRSRAAPGPVALVVVLGRFRHGVTRVLNHIRWSALRVFRAFVLAVLTAIPVGIMMGVDRVARGVFDPLLFDLGMRWLERRLVPWKGKA